MIHRKYEKGLYSPKDFSEYNKRLIKNQKGIDLQKGGMPNTFMWAVVENKVVGLAGFKTPSQ